MRVSPRRPHLIGLHIDEEMWGFLARLALQLGYTGPQARNRAAQYLLLAGYERVRAMTEREGMYGADPTTER